MISRFQNVEPKPTLQMNIMYSYLTYGTKSLNACLVAGHLS